MGELFAVLTSASLVNNLVLAYFVGLCPFFGVSRQVSTAVSFLEAFLLPSVPFLRLISYMVVIASLVQILEMAVKKQSPTLFREVGILLPLITTNCAILYLGLLQYARGYDSLQGIFFALGAGAGFTLALVLMASIRQGSEFAPVPAIARDMGFALIVAGSLSLAFVGFSGLLAS